MNKNSTPIQPGGNLKINFNKLFAAVGIGWFTSLVIMRYVIKPIRVNNRMKENEMLMNNLYDEQIKQKEINERNDV